MERARRGRAIARLDLRDRATAARRDPGRARDRAQSRAGPRSVAHRRLRVPAPGPGGGDIQDLSAVAQRVIDAGNQSPELRNLFTTFRPNVPEIFVDLDRAKAKALGVPIDSVFETLGVYMGGTYINDFDRFGRLFRVYAQAEGDLRTQPEDISRLWARSTRGEMVPLSTLVSLSRVAGPRDISHYNAYRSVRIQGEAAPGFSSGQALDRMEAIAKEVLPATMSYEWTGTAYQERRAGSAVQLILAFRWWWCSCSSRHSTRAGVCRSSSCWRCRSRSSAPSARSLLRGLNDDLYCQIGLVTLIGSGVEELDPDRRVRAAPAPGGRRAARRRARGGERPLPAGADDGLRVHPRRRAAGARDRRGRRGAAFARHGGVRRHARGDGAVAGAGTRPLRDRRRRHRMVAGAAARNAFAAGGER